MTKLWQLTASELAAKVRSRDVSAREVATSSLDRLNSINPVLNAVVDHDPKKVLARADDIDRIIARGEDPGELAGVPVTVKLNIDQKGFSNTNGVRLQRNLIAETNSPIIDNLEHAGAIVIGRTNAPAFSFRWFTSNQLYGSTKNPRDFKLTPGGSSGGAAVATATGICAFAHGTDIAGSIRYPAYACGVHGLRPSLGRVPAFNTTSPERPIGQQLMAVSGPIARTIADLRLSIAAMARQDSRDAWWSPAPLVGPDVERRAALCLRPGGLNICREVEDALLEAARHLESAGWRIEQIEDLPMIEEAAELNMQLWLADGFEKIVSLVEKEDDPDALALMNFMKSRAKTWNSETLLKALTRRSTIIRAWRALLTSNAILMMPISGELPFEDGLDTRSSSDFERVVRAQITQLAIPPLGLPALAVSTQDGSVPVGVQLVAASYREDLCLLAGEVLESQMSRTPIDPCLLAR